MNEYIIEMLGITKEFPGIKANDNINLQLKKGEIHALLGENGAGKSTLMSVLFGLYEPDEGIIRINGEEVRISNPNEATKYGIGMVHQHFKLVDVFSVLDNIILGAESTKMGFLKRKLAKKKILELSERYSMKIDPDARVENITVGMQQKVEILKMLYRNNDILIFDEPTAVLTVQETQELMKTMKKFADEGKSILFITHKLDEIMAVSDRVSVLRKGRYIGTVETASTNKQMLSEMMVGRSVQLKVDKQKTKPKDTVLEVKNLIVSSRHSKNKNAVNGVSFKVRQGEILCVAGIDGNGQSELIHAITGLEKISSGKVLLCGKDITDLSVRKKNMSGLSHIPEDRHKHGLVLDFKLQDNLVLHKYFQKPFSKNGIINRSEIEKYASRLIENFDVRCGEGPDTVTRHMSGGNQQKAIIGREFDRNEPLIIAVQPTRGLDVGAIEAIHKRLVEKRDEGKAVLLVSLELDEVLSVSDRIIVMYEGEIVAEMKTENANPAILGMYMSGAKRDKEVNRNE